MRCTFNCHFVWDLKYRFHRVWAGIQNGLSFFLSNPENRKCERIHGWIRRRERGKNLMMLFHWRKVLDQKTKKSATRFCLNIFDTTFHALAILCPKHERRHLQPKFDLATYRRRMISLNKTQFYPSFINQKNHERTFVTATFWMYSHPPFCLTRRATTDILLLLLDDFSLPRSHFPFPPSAPFSCSDAVDAITSGAREPGRKMRGEKPWRTSLQA